MNVSGSNPPCFTSLARNPHEWTVPLGAVGARPLRPPVCRVCHVAAAAGATHRAAERYTVCTPAPSSAHCCSPFLLLITCLVGCHCCVTAHVSSMFHIAAHRDTQKAEGGDGAVSVGVATAVHRRRFGLRTCGLRRQLGGDHATPSPWLPLSVATQSSHFSRGSEGSFSHTRAPCPPHGRRGRPCPPLALQSQQQVKEHQGLGCGALAGAPSGPWKPRTLVQRRIARPCQSSRSIRVDRLASKGSRAAAGSAAGAVPPKGLARLVRQTACGPWLVPASLPRGLMPLLQA